LGETTIIITHNPMLPSSSSSPAPRPQSREAPAAQMGKPTQAKAKAQAQQWRSHCRRSPPKARSIIVLARSLPRKPPRCCLPLCLERLLPIPSEAPQPKPMPHIDAQRPPIPASSNLSRVLLLFVVSWRKQALGGCLEARGGSSSSSPTSVGAVSFCVVCGVFCALPRRRPPSPEPECLLCLVIVCTWSVVFEGARGVLLLLSCPSNCGN